MLTSSDSEVFEVSQVSGVQAPTEADRTDTPLGTPKVSGLSRKQAIPSILPKETDRPCYRVLDEPHQEGDAKYRAGVWYFGIKAGRGEAAPTLVQQWICSPMHIDVAAREGGQTMLRWLGVRARALRVRRHQP